MASTFEEAYGQAIRSRQIVNDVFTIDAETRSIQVPESETLFGVYSDQNVERKYFTCPRIVGDGVDLSECDIFINYISSSGKPGKYWCQDVEVVDDNITFTWLLSNNVFDKNVDGFVYFAMQAKRYSTDLGQNETVFNTLKAQGYVFETVAVDAYIEEQYADVILQIIAKMDEVETRTGVIETKTKEIEAKMKTDFVLYAAQQKTANQQAQARENIGAVSLEDIQSIIDEENIAFIWKGEWVENGQDGKGYVPNDVVSYKGNLYISLANNTYENPIKHSLDWELFLKGGEVTAENINTALGYQPADKKNVDELSREKADKKDLEGLASETYVDDKVEDLKVNGIQQTPLFANSIEECTDTTKLYVLPDGMIYGCIPVEKENYENAVETSRNYGNTDVYNDGKGYKDGVYLSSEVSESNSGDGIDADYTSTGFIPIAFKSTGIFPTLYIKGLEWVNKSHSRLYLYSSTPSLISNTLNMIGSNSYLEANFTMESLGEKYWKLTPKDTLYSNLNNAIPSYFRMSLKGSGENLIISLDNPIETVIGYEWKNTGHAFIQADYEDRIIDLEAENEQLKKELTDVKQSLNDIERNDSVGVPDYVVEEAKRVAKQVYSHQNANTFTFFAVSDMHEHLTNEQIMTSNFHAGKAMELIRSSVHVDFAVCLGDIGWGSGVKGSATRATIELGIAEIRSANAKIDGAFRGIPNFRTTGNHCNLAYNYEFNGNDYLDGNELFPLYGAYNTGAVYPVREKDRGYCHRDFEDWKLRVICMNSSDLKGIDVSGGTSEYTSGTQLKWFAELLDMSDKEDMSEWNIVIFSHLPLDYATSKQTVDILKAYLDGTEANLTKNNIEIKKNYAGKNGAVVIANIHGHNHCYNVDYLYQNSDADSKIDVQRICIPNACFERSNERGENGVLDQGDIEYGEAISYEKTANTANDTSFNVITIDPMARKIYADNYGAGIDREINY